MNFTRKEADKFMEKRIDTIIETAIKALEDKKAENVVTLNISRLTTVADYFIIATGNNPNQMLALSDAVTDALAAVGITCRAVEGYNGASWILIVSQDVVIHIFDRDSRSFYNLEHIWKGAEVL